MRALYHKLKAQIRDFFSLRRKILIKVVLDCSVLLACSSGLTKLEENVLMRFLAVRVITNKLST